MKDVKPIEHDTEVAEKDTSVASLSTGTKEEPTSKGNSENVKKGEESNRSYDAIEKTLGISEYYASTALSGFSAVVKARYSVRKTE